MQIVYKQETSVKFCLNTATECVKLQNAINTYVNMGMDSCSDDLHCLVAQPLYHFTSLKLILLVARLHAVPLCA